MDELKCTHTYHNVGGIVHYDSYAGKRNLWGSMIAIFQAPEQLSYQTCFMLFKSVGLNYNKLNFNIRMNVLLVRTV